MSLRVVSHGGGVQTTAMLVLCATGKLDYRTFLFANTGDDSENPATLTYLHEVARPYAERHGIEIHELDRVRRDGSVETLYGRLTRQDIRSIDIPVRMTGGDAEGAPGRRNCTKDFKITVVDRWLIQRGARPPKRCRLHVVTDQMDGCGDQGPRPNCPDCDPGNIATVAVGITVDEIERVNNRHSEPFEHLVYPLLDLRMRRHDCERVIRDAGLPVPPKSACWFCPMKRPSQWQDQRRTQPVLFAKAADLEAQLIARRRRLGRDPAYLTRFGKPLPEAIADGQGALFEDDPHCDNGWCMT